MTILLLLVIFGIHHVSSGFWDGPYNGRENCICAVQEKCCDTSYVDEFNSYQFYPKIVALTNTPYFRFYKVNTVCRCPFWDNNDMCSIKNCKVDRCSDEELPDDLKSNANNKEEAVCAAGPHHGLDYLDKTISLNRTQFLKSLGSKEWEDDRFCELGDNEPAADYVDLPLNPERFTGYSGQASRIIWEKLYEGCKECDNYVGGEMHLLKRIISGMHASVNIHLCSLYPIEDSAEDIWDFDYDCFTQKFLAPGRVEQSAQWFRNLYFLYSIISRAILKSEGIWKDMHFNTGLENDDVVTKSMVLELTDSLKKSSFLLNEESDFFQEIEDNKDLVRVKFLNASKLMDCVGCEKCKLWGKLQTQGIGTALKILLNKDSIVLSRNEIVSLFNAAARYSSSIEYLASWKDFANHFTRNMDEL